MRRDVAAEVLPILAGLVSVGILLALGAPTWGAFLGWVATYWAARRG